MMQVLENLWMGANQIAGIAPLAATLAGVVLGIIVGAMPGLSPSMGVALLVPFTYGMSPTVALLLLVAIYIGASYGGSITAIIVNAPGTASSVVTAIDGYPMTRQGQAKRALGVSLVASCVAGMIGTIILVVFSAPLAGLATRFHPAEYFALAVFGLATVASMAGGNALRAFIAALIGLLLNTIGTDPISGFTRFSLEVTPLSDGFMLIPALIGLFALSEVFIAADSRKQPEAEATASGSWPRLVEYWRLKRTIFLSSAIGTVVGVFPGAGAVIASFIAYDASKRISKEPERYGKGSPEGVAAAEAANSGSVGGALVPLLTLGIPGSATTAVLIGAMMIHKLNPGPQLFSGRPEVVNGLFAGCFAANLILLAVGLLGARLWVKVTHVPKATLHVMIIALSVLGAFAVRNSMFDVWCCIGFGLLGWLLKRNNYPVAPIVLGLVLGSIAETNFRRAVMMDGFSVFLQRPASAIMLLIGAASFILTFTRFGKRKSA
jgi:putative tricarboxylic transport membrane protein